MDRCKRSPDPTNESRLEKRAPITFLNVVDEDSIDVFFLKGRSDMKGPSKTTRREFNLSAAMAILSTASITISGCGGSSSTPTTPSTPTPPPPSSGGGGTSGDVTGVIGTNHGHTGAVITAAQLSAGMGFQLDITGDSNHPHTIDITVADLTQIQAGARVVKVSSNDQGHTHQVTFN